MVQVPGGEQRWRFVRFVANGTVAAAVHFSALYANIHILGLTSAGLANGLAAIPGLTASFVGNRYFVFDSGHLPVVPQAGRFLALYAATALLHGLFLLGWTDLAGLDYRIGFLLATGLQVVISYFGNRAMVFKP